MGNCIEKRRNTITIPKKYKNVVELVGNSYYDTPHVTILYQKNYLTDFDGDFQEQFIDIFVNKIFPMDSDENKQEYANMLCEFFLKSREMMPKNKVKAMQLRKQDSEAVIYKVHTKLFDPQKDKIFTVILPK